MNRIGNYDVVGQLAVGGMAEILLARLSGPSGFGRVCVIKRILPHLANKSTFVDMFLDEARIAAEIRHVNVVTVTELARDGDELFLVMEYLEGESLHNLTRRMFRRREPLAMSLSAFIVAQACAGLHAAHELTDGDGFLREVVHRDVSPDNVFVTYAGNVKILDFGVVQAENRIAETQAGQVKGKFAYMSPEQCLGKRLDRRSDVFSLGIVAWELVTGRRLFTRDSELLTFRAICEDRIPAPSEFVHGLSTVLDGVIMQALCRRREDRHQTAQAMRTALLAAARQLQLSDVPEDELSRLMQRLFANRILQKQDMLRRFQAGSTLDDIPLAETDEHVELPTIMGDMPTSSVSAVPRSSRRWAAPALLVLAALGTGFAVARLAAEDETMTAVVPAAPTLAAAPAPGPTSAGSRRSGSQSGGSQSRARAKVLIQVQTTPKGATVTVEGRRYGVTPLDVELDREDTNIEIRVTLLGHAPRTTIVTPDMSQRLVLSLTPIRSRLPRPPKPVPRPPKPVIPVFQ